LEWFLIHAHNRPFWVMLAGINRQSILHCGRKRAVLSRWNAPACFQVRLKLCFFKRRLMVICDIVPK
jgi:hypothetical protein